MTRPPNPSAQAVEALGHVAKFLGLFEKYGVEIPSADQPSLDFDGAWSLAWQELAYRLAVAHEPGMKVKTGKPGRRRSTKTFVQDCNILLELGVKHGERSVLAAAQHLSKRPDFKGLSPRYLRKRYYELLNGETSDAVAFRKSFRALARDAEINPSP
jgi:hypothetical protein